MVSNGATIDHRWSTEKGSNLHNLVDYAVVRKSTILNPSMVILSWSVCWLNVVSNLMNAISIVRSMTAYTNHTIPAEASLKMASWILGRSGSYLVPIIKELDRRVKVEYKDPACSTTMWLTCYYWLMDIHYGYNGVVVFTLNLKNSWVESYDIYPELTNKRYRIPSLVHAC